MSTQMHSCRDMYVSYMYKYCTNTRMCICTYALTSGYIHAHTHTHAHRFTWLLLFHDIAKCQCTNAPYTSHDYLITAEYNAFSTLAILRRWDIDTCSTWEHSSGYKFPGIQIIASLLQQCAVGKQINMPYSSALFDHCFRKCLLVWRFQRLCVHTSITLCLSLSK